jgi:hypothetical protein
MRKFSAPRGYSLPLILLVMVAMLGLTGCKKQLANHYLGRANKRVQAAIEHEAPRFSADALTEAQKLIAEVQSKMSQQAFDQALEQAKVASEKATQLLESTKQRRASALKKEADDDVRVANNNLGNTINPQLYEKITKNNDAAQVALSKSKYEKTIELSLSVKQDVQTLLTALKEQAEENTRKADSLFADLLRELAQEHAPQYVTDTKKKIDEMKVLVTTDRAYRQANQVFSEIEALAQTGITESRRSRSKQKIQVLDRKLLRAFDEGAEQYRPDFLLSCQQNYSAILKNFYPPIENFVNVLEAADLLEPQIDRLILETRIASATDKLQQVDRAIRMLGDDRVRDYLPGRLDRMEALLKQAKGQFDQNLFDECKELCKTALEEKEVIISDFDELSAKEIRTASGQLDQADKVLERMGKIFDVQSPATDDPVEQQFENTKESLRTALLSITRDARILLGAANVQRQDQQFSNAIENARQVVLKSNYAIRETFHVVAHNNVLELVNQLNMIARDGGDQFAPKEMAAAKDVMESARTMIREQEAADTSKPENLTPDDYRPAVSRTAEAKASVDTVIHQVTQAVVAKIDTTKTAIAQAEINKAGVYALGPLTTARQVLEGSESALQAGKMLDSANQADEAGLIANQAMVNSLEKWAKDEIAAAENEMQMAQSANAFRDDAPQYKKALDEMDTARGLFKDVAAGDQSGASIEHLIQARDLAIAARKDALSTRMKPISTANEAITTARRFNAWEYDYSALMQSIVDAKSALEAMRAGNYELSRTLAMQASLNAETATNVAKDTVFRKRMSEAASGLQKLAAEGGLHFAVEDVKQIIAGLQQVKGKYSTAQFETVSAQLDAIETNIYTIAQKVPAVFYDILNQQTAIYTNLVNRGAKDFADKEMADADKALRYAKMDFEKKNFRSSYDDLRQAIRTLGNIDLQFTEREFVTAVRALISEFTENLNQVRPILSMSPAFMHQVMGSTKVKTSANAVMLGTDVIAFREKMETLHERSQKLSHPITMTNAYDELVESFALARKGSIAIEKFHILDHYDEKTANKIVDEAYDLMGKAIATQKDLSSKLEEEGLQGPLADAQFFLGNSK